MRCDGCILSTIGWRAVCRSVLKRLTGALGYPTSGGTLRGWQGVRGPPKECARGQRLSREAGFALRAGPVEAPSPAGGMVGGAQGVPICHRLWNISGDDGVDPRSEEAESWRAGSATLRRGKPVWVPQAFWPSDIVERGGWWLCFTRVVDSRLEYQILDRHDYHVEGDMAIWEGGSGGRGGREGGASTLVRWHHDQERANILVWMEARDLG